MDFQAVPTIYTLEPVPGQPGDNNNESTLGAASITKQVGFADTVLGAQHNLQYSSSQSTGHSPL